MPTAPATPLPVRPLTSAAFAPFGEVIDVRDHPSTIINDGFARKQADLFRFDAQGGGGRPTVHLYRARRYPIGEIRQLECHRLGSQAFLPLTHARLLIVVAPPGPTPDLAALAVFVTDGRQGCNYARGVWHHPLAVLDGDADVLVFDRTADTEDCDLFTVWPPHPIDGTDLSFGDTQGRF